MVITNNIPRYTGEAADITYAAGYDASVMDQFGNVIIAGVVSTPSRKYDGMAFTPGSWAVSALFGAQTALDVAEFKLADNFGADEFRAVAQEVCDSSIGKIAYIMDTSELENLRNTLRLLETLYPLALTVALLIGVFLCCLVIVQSSKEAAIMRILGTAKGKTRVILTLEQIVLSVAGLIVGVGGLLLYKGQALTVVSAQLTLFAALTKE